MTLSLLRLLVFFIILFRCLAKRQVKRGLNVAKAKHGGCKITEGHTSIAETCSISRLDSMFESLDHPNSRYSSQGRY